MSQETPHTAGSDQPGRFKLELADFLSAREHGAPARTHLRDLVSSLNEAGEALFTQATPESSETEAGAVKIVSPVVIPKRQRALLHLIAFLVFAVPTAGAWATAWITGYEQVLWVCWTFFGPTMWGILVFYLFYILWKRTTVMVPDGFHALVTRFGRLDEVAAPGRLMLFNPWRRVSFLVNVVTEFPYNAPIREAPTASRIMASVDLFLQFRIEDAAEFIYSLGGAEGFEEKLQNAVSEVTRSLIYEQKAEAIYDLVGENLTGVLDALNSQFLPAVRFVRANITHAEPSDPKYRMDLAAKEFMRVAEEAYSFEYELSLRKENDRGDLNRELAKLRKTLSEVEAETARYQALAETAMERELNRVKAHAHLVLVEATSAAKARAALFEAQALDVRALSLTEYPALLRHRYEHKILDRLEGLAGSMPQIVKIGPDGAATFDFEEIGRQMLGLQQKGWTPGEALAAIRKRADRIRARIEERAREIEAISAALPEPQEKIEES